MFDKDPGNSSRMTGARTLLYSSVLGIVFLIYYFSTSAYLPLGAGPDYASHNGAVRFIYEHGRLATFPEDEPKLHFTVYGGTRLLRPPLSYAVAAGVAHLLGADDSNWPHMFRKGSSTLCALTVVLTFYGLVLYFQSYGIALVGALLIGLLPQFAFIASYNNDDSGALLAATLLMVALIRIFRKGVTLGNAVLLGLAGGIVILAKETAWLLLPTLVGFVAAFVRAAPAKLARYGAVVFVVGMLSGGWWLVFNVYHYGIDDPFLLKTVQEVAGRHSRFPPGEVFGYKSQGVGYADLIVHDYDGFWNKTGASTVGDLDWLRIRLGWWQYGLYLAVLAVGLLGYAVRTASWLLNRAGVGALKAPPGRDVIFETLLVFAIGFQLFMYTWANINNDVQLQGKYLLPIFMAPLLLFLSTWMWISGAVAPSIASGQEGSVLVARSTIRNGLLGVAVAGLLLTHVNALLNYVIPFYVPGSYTVNVRPMAALMITPDIVTETNEVSDLEYGNGSVAMVSTGRDPWIVLRTEGEGWREELHGDQLLKIVVYADQDGVFQVFVDDGNGFREEESHRMSYHAGRNELYFVLGVQQYKRIRLDPAQSPSRVTIEEIGAAGLRISGPR
jgi:4-amino-4-deoxy-L-arabinose transferase-like glycosyltransferase